MRKKYKILFFVQDVGGFDSIRPIIKGLKKDKAIALKVFLAGASCKAAKNLKFVRCYNFNKNIILKEKPDLIFTGTSLGKSIEKFAIEVGRKEKIKTIAIVDFWSNYKKRFSEMPDYILAIDSLMKKEMIKEGFDPKKIIVTGNPSFESFFKKINNNFKKNSIVFFSQPFSELIKEKKIKKLGYNEIEVFKDIVETLEKIEFKKPVKIKFHPGSKQSNKFDTIIRKSNLKIFIEKHMSFEDLIQEAELIIGMNSAALFYAAIVGKPVISYQPNLKNKDVLITNRLKISRAVYEKENLEKGIKEALLGKKVNTTKIKKYNKKSVEKIVNIINKIRNAE